MIDNDIKDKGEFQLTDALENMKNKGTVFVPGKLTEWLDCGNKNATVYTNQRYLEFIKDQDIVSASHKATNSVVIPPVYIGEDVEITNCVIGPHVSIGNGTKVENSVISNSIIQENTEIKNANFSNSMVGNFVNYQGRELDLSIGDFNTVH